MQGEIDRERMEAMIERIDLLHRASALEMDDQRLVAMMILAENIADTIRTHIYRNMQETALCA